MVILKHLFPVPKPDSKRVITFANDSDYVSFRHHTYRKSATGDVELTEVCSPSAGENAAACRL